MTTKRLPKDVRHAVRTALISIDVPQAKLAEYTQVFVTALSRCGFTIAPPVPNDVMLRAANEAMRQTGFLIGGPKEVRNQKQALRYQAMLVAERRRQGVEAPASE